MFNLNMEAYIEWEKKVFVHNDLIVSDRLRSPMTDTNESSLIIFASSLTLTYCYLIVSGQSFAGRNCREMNELLRHL